MNPLNFRLFFSPVPYKCLGRWYYGVKYQKNDHNVLYFSKNCITECSAGVNTGDWRLFDGLSIVDGSGGRPVEGRGDVAGLPPGPPHPVHVQNQGLPHSEMQISNTYSSDIDIFFSFLLLDSKFACWSGLRIHGKIDRIRIRPWRKPGSGFDLQEKSGSGSYPRKTTGFDRIRINKHGTECTLNTQHATMLSPIYWYPTGKPYRRGEWRMGRWFNYRYSMSLWMLWVCWGKVSILDG